MLGECMIGNLVRRRRKAIHSALGWELIATHFIPLKIRCAIDREVSSDDGGKLF